MKRNWQGRELSLLPTVYDSKEKIFEGTIKGGIEMKGKLTACILASSLVFSLAVPALAAEKATGKDSGKSDTSVSVQQKKDSVLYYGRVAEIIKDEQGNITSLAMQSEAYGAYTMNLDESVVWIDSGKKTVSDPATLAVGEGIYIFHSPASTMSLPPQSAAYAIMRNIPQDTSCANYHVVDSVETAEDGSARIVVDGLYISVDQNTGFSRYAGSEELSVSNLKAGDRIMAWYQVVLESYPGQTYANHIMLLPGKTEQNKVPVQTALEEGSQLSIELNGKTTELQGRYENGTTMIPVAAVAQALGFQVTYTPDKDGALVTVESDTFRVRLNIGNPMIMGVTKIPDAVGMSSPQKYNKAPYIVEPGTTWAPAQLFELLGKTVTLEGGNLIIK